MADPEPAAAVAVWIDSPHGPLAVAGAEADATAALLAYLLGADGRVPDGSIAQGVLVTDGPMPSLSAVADSAPVLAWTGAGPLPCEAVRYALADDPVVVAAPDPIWTASAIADAGGLTPLRLYVGGSATPTAWTSALGAHAIRNGLGAVALAATLGEDLTAVLARLRSFPGLPGRRELLGVGRGVRVYRDWHRGPDELREVVEALARRHPAGRVWITSDPASSAVAVSDDSERVAWALDLSVDSLSTMLTPGDCCLVVERPGNSTLAAEILAELAFSDERSESY